MKQSNESRAIGGILGLLILQFKVIFWICKWTFRICTFGYGYWKSKQPPPPLQIPEESRFEHTLVLAGSGHGKTQLLQSMIINDLQDVGHGTKSVIVIDSQGDMIRNILRLGILSPRQFDSIADRLVLIDPNDIENPPALNLFDFGLDRLKDYSLVEREKMVSGAIALFEYIFGALLGAELTNRQGTLFSYLARLLMIVPGANIHTLIDFMENPEAVTPLR
jgi:hypothetical protein